MVSKAEKLLKKARNSNKGWKRTTLNALYEGYGFVIESRSKHDIAYHEDYISKGLRTTLPRSNKVNSAYVSEAIRLIEMLMELQESEKEEAKDE
jgi:hypothetical protein